MFEITSLKMIDIIHQCMDELIRPGDTVCDCTMGNGHDTAYMCQLTGEHGTVYSFDIQQEAITRTKALLTEKGLMAPAHLILDSHMVTPLSSPKVLQPSRHLKRPFP